MTGIHVRPGGTRRKGMAWLDLVVAGGLALGIGSTAAADLLTAAERAWLEEHGPISFVSQTTYPPFEFVDSSGERQGMCLDLVRWISSELGFSAVFQDMEFQQAQAAVLEGRADVLTSLFQSEERDQRFDFSALTWEVPSLIFVRAERPDISRIQDLSGRRIAIPRGDYAEEFLRTKGIEYQAVPAASFAEAADRVLAGEADAMIGDSPIVLRYVYSRGIAGQMKSVGEPLYVGRNSMAVREGRDELLGILNKGLDLARARGVVETITTRWIGIPYGETPGTRPRQTLALSLGIISALAMAILLLGWIVHLRRLVGQRTVELQEAQDAHKPIAMSRPWLLLLVRLLLFLVLLVPLGFVVDRVLYRFVIMPDYLALEQAEAQKKLNGSMDVLRREAGHFGKTATDWAFWDDTYAFMLDRNEAYVDSNLSWPGLSDQAQIDVLLFYDLQGNLLWQGAYDPFEKKPIALADFLQEGLPKESALFRHLEPTKPCTGLLHTEIGPMIVASCAILPTDMDQPARGTLVLGRFLRETDLVADLSGQMGVAVELADPHSATLSEPQRAALSRLEPGSIRMEESSPDLLVGTALMADVEGRPALLLTLKLPRDIVARGRATARLLSSILFEFILIILVGTAIWYVFSFRESFRRQAHVEALVEARTRALRDSERKWKNYVKSAPMGIFLSDSSGRYQEANPAACRMTGYAETELAGRTLADLLAPECREGGREHVRQASEHGHASGEFRFLHKNGDPRGWSVSTVRLDDHRLLDFAEDVTDRQQEEKARESLQDQLSQAQKMESIGRLAGGVAHDFNNMLHVILGTAEMASEKAGANPALQADLEEIRSVAQRSADLTRQLLAFARKQTIAPRVLDLNETIEGTLKMLLRLIGENVELVWRPGSGLWPVKIDPSQIDQVMANLCLNARDAIAGHGTIVLSTGTAAVDAAACVGHEGAVPGDYVWLSITDDGCGMDEEMRQHVFEPFYTTKGVGEGTGLGLATVYGIVVQNGGIIEVQSEKGRGSTFRIYLPRHRDKADVPPGTEAVQAVARGHETILLVEDEPSTLQMTCRMLEHHGYKVLPAVSPGEAIRLAREHSGAIHLLMTDVVMPEMNGRDLARTLLGLYPGVKCLFMSGYTADIIANHGILDDDVLFIQKPFAMKDLVAKIREVLTTEKS